jgi:hypothetical protein
LRTGREAALAWEQRWSRPVALATFASILLIVAAILVASQGVGGGDGEAELLRNIDAHRSAELLSSILQAIGVGLLAAPLYYLFRAAQARSERMQGPLVGMVIVGPLFLAVLAVLGGITSLNAASDFVANEVPRLTAKGVALSSDRANEVASETLKEGGLRTLAAISGFAGQLAFIIGMIYTALHAMRVGLLTRFWGSLGIAFGAVSFLFLQFTLLWFIYLGLLLMGWVPGGRPPAWQSGEAEPWPTAGEKASAAMQHDEDPPIDGEATEIEDDPASLESTERRKRKQRD